MMARPTRVEPAITGPSSGAATQKAGPPILYLLCRKRHFLILLGVLSLVLASCSGARPSNQQAIVGAWVNSDGYRIEFYQGGKGFIPGVEGKIPSTGFTYSFADDSHIRIEMAGAQYDIGVAIAGDKLTWKDQLGEVTYTRSK